MTQALKADTDCLEVGRSVVGDTCERWSLAIRSVNVRDADRLHVDGPDEHPVPLDLAVQFAPEPIHPRNTPHEKRFIAMMLLIVSELRPYGRNERRACTKELFRGKQHREVVTADGEFDRVYVPKGSQGGLAGRLGCCVRTVDHYLRIARAARLIDVWQMPKKAAKVGQAGKKYGYAVFRYLLDLPKALIAELRRRRDDTSPRARETEPSRLHAAAPPAAAPGDWDDELEQYVASLKQGLKGPPRAPT